MTHRFPEPETMRQLAGREMRLLAALDGVIQRRAWSVAEIRDHQLRMLRDLLAYAAAEVPLYQKKYAAVGFQPSQVQSLADLSRIPFLSKDELRGSEASSLRSVERREPAWLVSSSGSTGVPSRVYRSDESLWHYTAYEMALYYEWCRGQPIEQGLYLLDLAPGGIDLALADLLRTTVPEHRIVSVAEPTGNLIERIEEFKPEYISSYPSTMRNVAIAMRRLRRTDARVRLLHLTSERLDSRTRRLLGDVFPQAEIVETYTSTEAGLMACQCHDGAWHVCEDNVIVEIVDADGRPTEDSGEMVVTDLTNWATPMIRYRGLGDYVAWGGDACRCGAAGRVLANLEGRSAESIVRADGSWLSPYALTNALEEVSGIHQCQIIQFSAGNFEIHLVRDVGSAIAEDEIAAAARKALCGAIQEEVPCVVRYVEQIPPKENGHKSPLVISHVGRNE